MTLHIGDCLDVMAQMPPNSVDAVVTDPPYGLEFMGKEWDRLIDKREQQDHKRPENRGQTASPFIAAKVNYRAGLPAQQWHQQWAEAAFRVAKPGAYLLAFGGTRTYHRLACAIEDAGWIIRDCLVWAYAQGFPKSRALLKPAWEPIVMARKPGPLRELAIDACRIPTDEVAGPREPDPSRKVQPDWRMTGGGTGDGATSPLGRWPANVILTDPIFDGGVDGVVGGGEAPSGIAVTRNGGGGKWYDQPLGNKVLPDSGYGDTGTYSRFFLIPKADRAEREPVFGGPAERVVSVWGGDEDDLSVGKKSTIPRRNHHPTVKPLDLMRHLVRLVTPSTTTLPDGSIVAGTVLDPFAGSGTTLIAAEMEGFAWIGVEREAEYVAIAEARLQGVQRGLGLDVPAPTPRYATPPDSKMPPVRFHGGHDNAFGIPYDRRAEPEEVA